MPRHTSISLSRFVVRRLVFDAFQNQFFSSAQFDVYSATVRAYGNDIFAFEFAGAGSAESSDGQDNNVELGALGLRSLCGVFEGLLHRWLHDSLESSDSYAHTRYPPAGGMPLHGFDDSIAHAQFMHISSLPGSGSVSGYGVNQDLSRLAPRDYVSIRSTH
jgi:hypothetical protein